MAGAKYWRREAHKAISDAIDQGKAQGLTGIELKAFVRKNGYPFGQRAMWPYKVWLSEMRRRFGGPCDPLNLTDYDAWLAEMKRAFAAGPTTSPAARDP